MADNEISRHNARTRRILRHTDDGHINAKVLNFLIYNATQRKTVGLKRLMVEVGIDDLDPPGFARIHAAMDEVFDWCYFNKWPMMTSLVVLQQGGSKGLPGKEFWRKAQQVESDIKFSPHQPLIDMPQTSQEVYVQWQHHMCFGYFAPLVSKRTEEVQLNEESTTAATSMPVNRQPVAPFQRTYTLLSAALPAVDQLSNDEMDGLTVFMLEKSDDERMEAIASIQTDDNYRIGKHVRAIRSFMTHHGIGTDS